MSLECRTDGCHRAAVLGVYCEPCTDQREQVFEHGGTLDGVQVAPRLGSRPLEKTRSSIGLEVRAVRFDLQKFGRGYVWTRQAAIRAVREHAEASGAPPTKADSKSAIVGQLPSEKSAKQLFGSWEEMLGEAGLVVPAHPPGSRKAWTREEIVEAMQRYVAEHGQIRADDWIKPPDGCPARSTVIVRFGSWKEAMRAAGLEPGRSGPAPRREEVAEESPPSSGSVEVPVDLIVELVGCAHEIERLEASLATARTRYHALLSQLHTAV